MCHVGDDDITRGIIHNNLKLTFQHWTISCSQLYYQTGTITPEDLQSLKPSFTLDLVCIRFSCQWITRVLQIKAKQAEWRKLSFAIITWQRLSGFHLLHLLMHFLFFCTEWRSVSRRLPLQLPEANHLHEGLAAAAGVAVNFQVQVSAGERLFTTVTVSPCKPGGNTNDGMKVMTKTRNLIRLNWWLCLVIYRPWSSQNASYLQGKHCHKHHQCTYLNKLPSELRLPLFFFSTEDEVPSCDLWGEGVVLSLLRPDILKVFPSFPKDLSGDLNLIDPFPEIPPPVLPSLASFSSSSSSNGLRSLGPSPSRRDVPGDQWCRLLWSLSLSKGMLILRLILRRINAWSGAGPPPFKRWFLLTGIRRGGGGGQVGRNLWKGRE